MNEKALNFLGLMRKANAVSIGETDAGAAVRSGKARLLLLAKDASDNAASRARGFVHGRDVPLITAPFTKDEISEHVGKSGCSMAAICDIGFARAFMKDLAAMSPEEYSEAAGQIEEVYARTEKRKSEQKAHERNMKTGKRRNMHEHD